MPIRPPQALAAALARETAGHERTALQMAAQDLSQRYRSGAGIPSTLSPSARAAYLAVRFPSTFAIAASVWHRIIVRLDLPAGGSVLDAGAGPGTASLALCAAGSPRPITLLERDTGWRDVSLRLAHSMEVPARFVAGDLGTLADQPPHATVVASHVLNEMPREIGLASVIKLWRLAEHVLVLIEPGTPSGFAAIRAARDAIVAQGGHIVAPCTHALACPIKKEDWCHFDVQVERTALHRAVKSATLSHESNKFSYLAVTRRPVGPHAGGRIVRRPIHGSGHVHLDICQEGRIERKTISRREGANYRQARDLVWGDVLED